MAVCPGASASSKNSESVTFFVGQHFQSFNELQLHLKKYESENNVQFWRRDSRTVEAAQKRINRPLSTQIQYYEVSYRCIHGGKKFKPRGEGKRVTSTFRKDCNAGVSFRASDDGLALVVRSFDDNHNHPVSRELFKQLPQQRKLSLAELDQTKNLLQLKANKKMIQSKLSEQTGKVVLLKDLSNIRLKMNLNESRNNLCESVKRLKEIHGASVEILVSQSDEFMGIFFQDDEMKQIFNSYPELLCIDATYKLLELRFPVYIMLVEDGNGQSEIAATFLLMEETEQSLKSMVNVFKKHNPNWKATRVLMTDKDMNERDVLAVEFPSAELLICLFHTFRSFRREVVVDKMGITPGQRTMCLELLQQMAYSTSEENYDDLYTRFCDCAPATVVTYFNEQWHPIRNQWVMGMKYKSGNFLNGTNNRLECINQKLKSVIGRYSSLEEFIDKFFLILRVLRSERDHKVALATQKVPVVYHTITSTASISYMKYLTPYAYQFVSKQMELKEKVKLKVTADKNAFECKSSEGLITVTSTHCECTSWLSMKLPCRHILKARIMTETDLYDESLCAEHWTLAYYKLNQRIFLSGDSGIADDFVEISPISDPPRKRCMSQAEKFKHATRITTRLASLVSESSKSEFTARCGLLEKIAIHWEAGKSISSSSLLKVPEQSDNGENSTITPVGIHKGGVCTDDVICINLPENNAELEQSSATTEHVPGFCSSGKSNGHQLSSSVSDSQFNDADLDEEATTFSGNLNSGTNEVEVQSAQHTLQSLNNIKMPPIIQKRGRPKGHEVTVIGLPVKKKKKINSSTDKLQPFIKLHTSIKEKAMLKWFVDNKVMKAATKNPENFLIEEQNVETRPEKLPDALLDENVDIHLIRKFFTHDAWLVVADVVRQKQERQNFTCKHCYHDLHVYPSIACEHCLCWYHLRCVGLKQQPKTRYWFCRDCHNCPLSELL